MSWRAAGAAALLALLPGPALATGCGSEFGAADVRRIVRPQYTLAYRPEPAELETDQLFALRVVLCGRDGGPVPLLVRVGAWMPDHGHGMNYATILTAEGDGYWRIDGMMFHMPGRWELVFDVGTPLRTDRLVAEEEVE
ncbi:hypothetical protein STVA_13010 [Allostella vacuolata]|nr:hypothetical protein STVA_13010 [Stella vacuolata]